MTQPADVEALDDQSLPPYRRTRKRREFRAAVRKHGTIHGAAEAVDIDRDRVLDWLDRYPQFRRDFQRALDDFRESIEGRLLADLQKGDGTALRFKLRGEIPHKYGPRPSSPTGLGLGFPSSPPLLEGGRTALPQSVSETDAFWAMVEQDLARESREQPDDHLS